ncbi:MAG: hypothetical protein K2L42_02055 [Clostridia bacterium]|nr:hypothetical protein [Clostridia bacterium]
MDKSIILELTASGKCYFDDITMADNEAYNKCRDETNAMLENFCKDMGKEEKFETMCKFELAQGGLEAATADEYFKQGFKLGLMLGAQNFLE